MKVLSAPKVVVAALAIFAAINSQARAENVAKNASGEPIYQMTSLESEQRCFTGRPSANGVYQDSMTCGSDHATSGVCESQCKCKMPTMDGWVWECCNAECCP